MHQGRPYGLHVIGGRLTERDEAFISVTARRFSNLKNLSAVDSSRMVYDLPDGGYIVVQDMGGNFRVIAHKSDRSVPSVIDGMATDYIPMLYSGVVTNTTPFAIDGVDIRLTETTRRRLIDYDPNQSMPAKELSLHRFRIEYDNRFKYFEPTYKGAKTFTQYHKLRATWYSGAMSEVVQIIGGYGSQDTENLPDEPLERKTLKLPLDVTKSIRAYIANQRLPAYTGIPDFEGKCKYEYKHSTTNAVSFDEHNAPWLLQISVTGVYAMPLPVIPATTAPAFKDYLIEVNDDELLHIVDRFGGLPSGESFPDGDDFQAWYRAGVIIKVCDAASFYENNPFYFACGWAFNSQGTEGFNTCWGYSSNGMRYAYGFKMRLRLAAATDNGWTLNAKRVDNADAAILNNYIAWLFGQLAGNGARELAIRYKVMRIPIDELLGCAELNRGIDYWENLISKPIALHSGSVSQVSSGPMWWGHKDPESFGDLKFPNITGDGCQSFDMTLPDYKGSLVKCDTVVFGCYVNDQLTVIKYFIDEREFKSVDESNFEPVMQVGQWEKTTTTSLSGLQGRLYTTDFDDRRESNDNILFTQVFGEDLGYGNPLFRTPPLLYIWGSLTRYRYYSYKTQTTRTFDSNIRVAVCVPNLTRDCMLYAFKETSSKKEFSDSVERRSVEDPTSYGIWTYDWIYHYLGRGQGRGSPRPTTGEFVYANYDRDLNYNPTEYTPFADSGNWYGVPENSFKDVSSICAVYTNRSSENQQAGGVIIGGEAPQIETYSRSFAEYNQEQGRVSVSITYKGSSALHKNMPDEFYYYFSPQFIGDSPVYFYRDATWIACGTQKYSSTSEIKANGLRSYWGSTKLADHKSAHCFIGVINE